MKFIERVVNDIYYESKIAFQLIVDGVGVYSSPAFKIQKYTNYDIREFNEAVLLKIIFFIWKEKSEKNT